MNIKDIPIKDIEKFLFNNKISTYGDIYVTAWDLMQNGADYYPDSIIEWMMAYNVLKNKIPKYSRIDIYLLSPDKLKDLSKSLGMKTNDVNHIINILHYLHKLDTSMDILELLPKETILEIMHNMTFSNIKSLCNSSNKLQNICKSKEFKNMITNKLPHDSMDVSNFSLDELELYSKIIPLKKKMSILKDLYQDIVLLINDNSKIVQYFNGIKNLQIPTDNINKILLRGSISQLGFERTILTNNGNLEYDYFRLDYEPLDTSITEKIVDINTIGTDLDLICISSKGNLYLVGLGQPTLRFKFNKDIKVIKYTGNLLLTNKSEIYIHTNHIEWYYREELLNKHKPDLIANVSIKDVSEEEDFWKISKFSENFIEKIPENIIDITESDHILCEDGKVYEIIPNELRAKQIFNNIKIKQIYAKHSRVIFLGFDGNLYDLGEQVIKGITYAYEVAMIDNNIYALTKKGLEILYVDYIGYLSYK